jgi:hypothetical protein
MLQDWFERNMTRNFLITMTLAALLGFVIWYVAQ